MKILLGPDKTDPSRLGDLYGRAFREARELYIASAYLTNWDIERRVTSSCDRIVFVVGTDFGLTRKSALHLALRWLPKHGSVLFGAVSGYSSGGFHPKVLLWKTASGARYAIIGSSNLSKAAFGSNYEANVFTRVTATEYRRIAEWIDSIAVQSAAINEDWITNHYREAKRAAGHKGSSDLTPMVRLRLPRGPRYAARRESGSVVRPKRHSP